MKKTMISLCIATVISGCGGGSSSSSAPVQPEPTKPDVPLTPMPTPVPDPEPTPPTDSVIDQLDAEFITAMYSQGFTEESIVELCSPFKNTKIGDVDYSVNCGNAALNGESYLPNIRFDIYIDNDLSKVSGVTVKEVAGFDYYVNNGHMNLIAGYSYHFEDSGELHNVTSELPTAKGSIHLKSFTYGETRTVLGNSRWFDNSAGLPHLVKRTAYGIPEELKQPFKAAVLSEDQFDGWNMNFKYYPYAEEVRVNRNGFDVNLTPSSLAIALISANETPDSPYSRMKVILNNAWH